MYQTCGKHLIKILQNIYKCEYMCIYRYNTQKYITSVYILYIFAEYIHIW